MQKEFEKHQKLETLDETQKKEFEQKIHEEEEAKKHHQPVSIDYFTKELSCRTPYCYLNRGDSCQIQGNPFVTHKSYTRFFIDNSNKMNDFLRQYANVTCTLKS